MKKRNIPLSCFCAFLLAAILAVCAGCGTIIENPDETTVKKPPESGAIIYYDDENLQISDGAVAVESGDTVAAGRSIAVSYDNTENPLRTVIVYLNGEELFVVGPSQLDGIVLNTEAGKVYGITTESNVEKTAVLSFQQGITVLDANGKTVKTSGTRVTPGNYTARFSGGANGTYLIANGNIKASAVNGTSEYRFTVSDASVSLTLEEGDRLPLTNTMPDHFITDLKWAADTSVIYENGKYYMAIGCNWGVNGTSIWQIREADELTRFTHAGSKAYTAMTLSDFAAEVGTAYNIDGNWAPELQKIGDYYYIITAYCCTNHGAVYNTDDHLRPDGYKTTSHRTLAILRSRSLTEGWEVWLNHLNTPVTDGKTWDVIDGVIYMQDGDPYLVASHEYTSSPGGYGGSYFCVKLKKDLSGIANGAEWHTLFRVGDITPDGGTLSDAPYLYKNSKGELIMLWSTTTSGGYSAGGGYTIAMAKSSNGRLDGTWSWQGYLYDRRTNGRNIDGLTGGHPGLVRTAEGQMYLTLHLYHHESYLTNEKPPKRPAFIAVRENPETGLLEWGKDESFIEFDATAFASQSIVKQINAENYQASFTVRKARESGTYVGFALTFGDGTAAKILLDPANGKFATQGANRDSLSKTQNIVLDASDFVTLSVISSKEEGIKVFVNDVYSEEMTRDLRHNVADGARLKECCICSQEGSKKQTERILAWSFTM